MSKLPAKHRPGRPMPKFTLTLEATRGDERAARSLAILLKFAWRALGLRCVDAREVQHLNVVTSARS